MDRRVVTPEAVALDLQTATVATRGLGAMLDLVLQIVAALLVTVGLTVAGGDGLSSTVVVTVVLIAIFLIRLAYPVLMEWRFGATLGHMAMGLRVVTLDGSAIRVRQALARAAVGLFELEATFGVVALVTAGVREDGRRLGDLAAGTQLVSVRVGTGPAEAMDLTVPPRLESWAASLDTTGLGREQRVALRRYLGRAADLPPERRDDLAATLADKLLPRLAASRPSGASAHDTLVAIGATASGVGEPGPAERPPLPPPPPPPPSAAGYDDDGTGFASPPS